MRTITLRGVRAHAGQLALSVLAVALGVAFVSGTFSLRAMLSATFDAIVDSSIQADVYLRGADVTGSALEDGGQLGGARTPVPITLVDEVGVRDDVALALPEASGPVVLTGADGTAVLSGQAPSIAYAYDPRDPVPTLVDGRVPERSGEVALESGTLASSGLAVGDATTVVLGGQVEQVRVVGEVSLSAPMAGATLVLLDAGSAIATFAPDGLVTAVAVHAADGTSAVALRDALAAGAPGGVEAVTGEDLRAETSAAISDQLGFVSTFLLVFAGLALFVGTFIITNTFAMNVRRRTRELALLRAVGASPAQVFGSVVGQAVVVGLVGSVVGVAAGFGLVELVRVGLGATGMELVGDLPVTGTGVAVSLGVGVVVSVLAAALPARRAALVRPVEAMRDGTTSVDRSLRWRAWAGAALVVVGGGLVVAALAGSAGAGTFLGLGALALLVGVLVAAPAIVGGVLRVLAAPFVRLVRPLGGLARGNVTRNPRRTAGTAGALVVGMALVSATSVLALSARESVQDIVRQETAADLVLTSATGELPQGVVDDVPHLAGVASADLVTFGRVELDGHAQYVVGFPADGFGRSVTSEVTEGDVGALVRGQVAVMADAVDANGWELGGTVEIVDAARPGSDPVIVTIGAVVDSSAFSVDMILPPDLAEQVGATTPEVLFVRADGGSTSAGASAADAADAAADPAVAALRTSVAETVSPYVVVSVLTPEEFAGEVASQVESVLAIVYALLGLSVVIAVLGIVNTLALSVVERTREIGLLRAVGLGRAQLAGTIMIESVLVAVFGTAVGLAVGTGVAAAFPSVFTAEGLTTLAIPWAQLAGMLGLAVVVGLVAAVWPAARAARLPVLDAVSQE